MIDTISLDGWRVLITTALFGGFIWACVWYLVPFAIRARQLRAAARYMTSPSDSGRSRFLSPKALSRFRGFPGVERPLSEVWDDFVEAWRASLVTGRDDGPGTVNARHFFTQDVIVGRRSRALPEALPGVFAGVGVLGTFLGIAEGLSSIDITTGEADRLMDGVGGLMAGMSTAFSTSIWGILFSLLWLVSFRMVRHHLSLSLDQFAKRLLIRFPCEDPEVTLMRMAESNEQVRVSLSSLGMDIAAALEGAMDRTITPALGEVTAAVTSLAADMAGREMDGLEQLVESFRTSLSESLDADMTRFAEALRSAVDHQAETSSRISEFYAQLQETSEAQALLLEQTTDVSRTFTEGLSSLESSQVAISKATEASREMMESAALLSEEARTQTGAYLEASSALQNTLAGQLDTTRDHVAGIFDFWENFEARVDKMTVELTEALAELTTFTAQKIGEVFTKFDSEMATVVAHLGGTLAEVRDVTEDLPGLTKQLTVSIGSLPESLESASTSFGALVAEARALRSQSAVDLKTLSEAVGNAAERSAETLGPLTTAIPPMHQTAQALVAVFAETNTKLTDMRDELEKTREASLNRGFFGRGRARQ